MNDETIFGSSTDDWLQYYELSVAEEAGLFDAPVFATSCTTTTTTGTNQNLSPTNSGHSGSSGGSGQAIIPKGTLSKPIRRRSRASRKTPITLLNANTNNFRALVQQFTGSQSATLSFGARKGPINLNFATGSRQLGVSRETTTIGSYEYNRSFENSGSVPEHYNHYNQQVQHHYQEQQNQLVDKTNDALSSSEVPDLQNTSIEDYFLESTSLYELIGDA